MAGPPGHGRRGAFALGLSRRRHRRQDAMTEVTPELLLRAYAYGLFPMADSADSPDLYWFDPPMRGILPLDRFHASRSLRKTVRQRRFDEIGRAECRGRV